MSYVSETDIKDIIKRALREDIGKRDITTAAIIPKDKNVKAIVLRVNSPGGSALASDVIWREVKLAKQEKPVIASMGDVAASGGYYISCAADKIVASPNTITGSIGVFGIIPNIQKLLNDKIGITIDNVKTNENAGYMSINRPLTEFEREVTQKGVEKVYATFISHVAEGRKMTTEQVDAIGQGRVWSGSDAINIGLIDEFGGLERAIEIASEMAELDDYRTISLPEQKDPFTQIMEELTGKKTISMIKEEMGTTYTYFNYLKTISDMEGVQARLPYEINIH